jgi:F-type H+-transporting ATPase subunit delta
MMTKRQAAREARRMFHYCFVNESLDEVRVLRAVQVIVKSRRRGYLLLLGYFQRLVKLDYLQHLARVESAVPVPSELQARVKNGLVDKYGPGITTEFSFKPALIGGMRIQVGSDVYDGSVRHGLERLQRSFGIDGANDRNDQIELSDG